MRIGIDTTAWNNWRGFGRFTRCLINALLEVDRQNEYTLFFDSGYAKCAAVPAAARHVVVATTRAQDDAIGVDSRRSARDLWRMARAVSRQPLDLFFCPSIDSFFPLLGRWRKLLTVHDANIEAFSARMLPGRAARVLRRIKIRLALAQADRLVTGSAYAAKNVSKGLGWPIERIAIIPYGAAAVFRPPASRSDAQSAVAARFNVAAPYVLHVGGTGTSKNIPALLQAYAAVTHKFVDVSLVMVGKPETGPCTNAPVWGNDLGGQVRRLGFQPDEALALLYQGAQALVIPSLREGYGLPGVEAVACGTPVIATRESPLPDLLGPAAIPIDPYQPDQITQALIAILSGRERLAAMRAAALRLSGEFSWQSSARRAMELFADTMGSDA
jgi:glycosyltransferase involved in cell wall biosynthesis